MVEGVIIYYEFQSPQNLVFYNMYILHMYHFACHILLKENLILIFPHLENSVLTTENFMKYYNSASERVNLML